MVQDILSFHSSPPPNDSGSNPGSVLRTFTTITLAAAEVRKTRKTVLTLLGCIKALNILPYNSHVPTLNLIRLHRCKNSPRSYTNRGLRGGGGGLLDDDNNHLFVGACLRAYTSIYCIQAHVCTREQKTSEVMTHPDIIDPKSSPRRTHPTTHY